LFEVQTPDPGAFYNPQARVKTAESDLYPVERYILKQDIPGQGDGKKEQ
jgi:hypothetical protein